MNKEDAMRLWLSGNTSSKQEQLILSAAYPQYLVTNANGEVHATTDRLDYAQSQRALINGSVYDRRNLKRFSRSQRTGR